MSKFKFQNLEISLARIDGNIRICCMSEAFKKFPIGHEAITSCWRHYDPNFKWRRYPWSPW